MQQLKTIKLRSARISFSKKYQVLEKELDEITDLSDTQKSLLQSSLDSLKNKVEEIIEYRTKGALLWPRT